MPIVTTPVGAILEAVTDSRSALVVPPRDAAALAVAIERLLGDPELATRLGMAAREAAVQRFSKTSMLDRMEQVFEESLRSSGRGSGGQ